MVRSFTFLKEKFPSILIVDDIPSNLELLESNFRREGFLVHTALNAETALQLYSQQTIDLAIVDVMMPGVNGFELCRTFKEMSGNKFFPVILLTALHDSESRITGIKAGADDFISKPFEYCELITKIMSLLKLKALHEELDHTENVIFSLVLALEARDIFTKGHSTRVGDLAGEFVAYMGGRQKDQDLIRKSGILHDIGKMGVSEIILSKAGRLTEQEYKEVRKHTIIGEDICRPLYSLQDVLPAIRSHHERWDGGGFPDGLSGFDIPMTARVLSIVDAYDAMVSVRPYRNKRAADVSLGVIADERLSGQWDPELTGIFLEMMHKRTACQNLHVV